MKNKTDKYIKKLKDSQSLNDLRFKNSWFSKDKRYFYKLRKNEIRTEYFDKWTGEENNASK